MSLKKILFLLFLICTLSAFGQDAAGTPARTPEQEAARQTEKLQQELDLTDDQVKEVYEINLHYARQRQVSNTRAEAMERIKNKDNDLKRVLTEEQYEKLKNKQYQHQTKDTQTDNITYSSDNPVRGTKNPQKKEDTPSNQAVDSVTTNSEDKEDSQVDTRKRASTPTQKDSTNRSSSRQQKTPQKSSTGENRK